MSDYIDKSEISIEYKFFDETHETEFYLNLNGNNILAFERNNGTYTVRYMRKGILKRDAFSHIQYHYFGFSADALKKMIFVI